MAHSYPDMAALSKPPWSTIIKSTVITRIVMSVTGILLNGYNSVIVYKLPENCGNHFKLIQSLAAADISLYLIDMMMLSTYIYYYGYSTDVRKSSDPERYLTKFKSHFSPEFIISTICCVQDSKFIH